MARLSFRQKFLNSLPNILIGLILAVIVISAVGFGFFKEYMMMTRVYGFSHGLALGIIIGEFVLIISFLVVGFIATLKGY